MVKAASIQQNGRKRCIGIGMACARAVLQFCNRVAEAASLQMRRHRVIVSMAGRAIRLVSDEQPGHCSTVLPVTHVASHAHIVRLVIGGSVRILEIWQPRGGAMARVAGHGRREVPFRFSLGIGAIVADWATAVFHSRMAEYRPLPGRNGVAGLAGAFRFQVTCNFSRGVFAVMTLFTGSRTGHRVTEGRRTPYRGPVTNIAGSDRQHVFRILSLGTGKNAGVAGAAAAWFDRRMIDNAGLPGLLGMADIAACLGRDMVGNL